MSVVNGALANQTTFNNAFMSRTAPTTSTTAQVQLQNAGSTQVDDVQQFLEDISDSLGMTENDSNRDNYSSNNYVADGDDRKTAIGKLDTQLASTQSDLDDLEALNTQDISLAGFGSTPNAQGASLSGQQLNLQPASDTQPGGVSTTTQSFAGNKTFTGNVVVNGDFTVLGDNFTADVTNMEVEDKNILVNKGGNDATAEGAGVDVKRTTTNAAIRFDSSLTSKWALGLVGSLYEVVVSGVAQTISGLKTFSDGVATDTVAEKTSAAGVTIDGVLLKDGLTDGRDVSVDGNTLDSHVANTSNPHSVTKTQVGLGNVTNDSQLTRASGDFNSFTSKASPVGADIVLIEDSAASFAKKKATLTSLGLGGSSPLTTKGDLFTYDTANARLAVGSDGQMIMAASSQSTGLTWTRGYALGRNYGAKTSNYTATVTDDQLGVSTAGGAVTITLPAAGTYPGKMYLISKTNASASTNPVTISDGGSFTKTLYLLGEDIVVVDNGSAWTVVSRHTPTILCTAYQSGAQSISSATATTVLFDNTIHALNLSFNTATGVGTIMRPGYYELSGLIVTAASQAFGTNSVMYMFGNINGSDTAVIGWNVGNGTYQFGVHGGRTFTMTAGQTFSIRLYHTAAGSVSLNTAGTNHLVFKFIGYSE